MEPLLHGLFWNILVFKRVGSVKLSVYKISLMASLGLAFGAWWFPWESRDAPSSLWGCSHPPPKPPIGATIARGLGWRPGGKTQIMKVDSDFDTETKQLVGLISLGNVQVIVKPNILNAQGCQIWELTANQPITEVNCEYLLKANMFFLLGISHFVMFASNAYCECKCLHCNASKALCF